MNKLFIFFLTLVSNPVLAQFDSIPVVTVTGEYSVKVKPDYVIIGVSINKTFTSNFSELKTGFRIFEREDTRIRLFDFDEDDITETIIHAEKLDNKPVYIKDVFITVEDIDKLDEILLELHRKGFSNYKYFEYRVRKLNELKDSARLGALISAREKAVLLASTLGQSIGKAQKIEELSTPNYNWYNLQDRNNGEGSAYTINSNRYLIDPGYIVVMARVKVSFYLKPD